MCEWTIAGNRHLLGDELNGNTFLLVGDGLCVDVPFSVVVDRASKEARTSVEGEQVLVIDTKSRSRWRALAFSMNMDVESEHVLQRAPSSHCHWLTIGVRMHPRC